MKTDQDYLKGLLLACQASEGPTFTIEDLAKRGYRYREPCFEFHMKLLTDQGLIENDDGHPSFGLVKGADGFASWSVLLLRLTANGHAFIEALENDEVWARLKHGFRTASVKTLAEVAPKLLEGFIQNRLKAYLD